MTLSSRNSRQITVDNINYRWTISAASQAETELVKIVVQPHNHGQRLSVEVPCRDFYLNIQEPSKEVDIRGITPRLVRLLIDDTRRIGWTPEQGGTQFDVRCVIATLSNEGGTDTSTCHVNWRCPVCNESYSEDIEYGTQSPLLARCHRHKQHSKPAQVNVALFWASIEHDAT